MASSAPKQTPTAARSEDILSAKTDLCISNAIVKAGVGFGAGVVASAILFRRRPWPVLLGLGFGLGQGYADCERVFNPAAVPGFKIAGDESAKSSPYANFKPFSSSSSTSAAPAAAKIPSLPKPSLPPTPAVAEVPTIDTPAAAAELRSQAKDVKDAVVDKAHEIKEKVVGKSKEVEGKLQQKKADLGDKKWV